MNDLTERIQHLDGEAITLSLNDKGYDVIPCIMTTQECDAIAGLYSNNSLYRKTVVMERHQYGLGEYRYFNYPLPESIATMRASLYKHLSPVANLWMQALGMPNIFPANLEELHEQCKNNNQLKPTPLILKYGKGGFNTLHQDIYGDIYFPMQALIMLNEPDEDYTGGEFVLTEQVPRAQSKAIVLRPKKGDMLIFTTNFRPVKSSRGYRRVNMRHGVSEVHEGKRMALGIIFHDAIS